MNARIALRYRRVGPLERHHLHAYLDLRMTVDAGFTQL